jgi:preprotein translocase subunit Sec63
VGNSFENSENNRFRFNTDGFYVVLLGLFLYRVILGWYRRRRLFAA